MNLANSTEIGSNLC